MSSLFRALASLRARFGRAVEDSLPMPPEEREERDWTGESGQDDADRRQVQFRVQTREKKGKGTAR